MKAVSKSLETVENLFVVVVVVIKGRYRRDGKFVFQASQRQTQSTHELSEVSNLGSERLLDKDIEFFPTARFKVNTVL